jgi:hypothetical protein
VALAAVDGWGRKEEVVVGGVDGGGGGGGCVQIRLSVAQQRSPTRVTGLGNQRVGNCRAEPMTCTPRILPYPYPHSLSRLYY